MKSVKRRSIIVGMLLVLVLSGFFLSVSIRREFTGYLIDAYPGETFSVEFVKVDFIYGKYYAGATSLKNNTSFAISKSFGTGKINEDYLQTKSQNQYNSRLRSIFQGNSIERDIKNLSGGGKMPFDNPGVYDQINVTLTDDARHIPVTKKVLNELKEHDISAQRVIISFEKDRHVYEIWLSSDDHLLEEREIEAKVRKIK